jgi:hypothetical protein
VFGAFDGMAPDDGYVTEMTINHPIRHEPAAFAAAKPIRASNKWAAHARGGIFQRKEDTAMRMKTIKALGTATRWIQRVIEVRLPVGALYGLRTR